MKVAGKRLQMRRLLYKVLKPFSNNARFQIILEDAVATLQLLMSISSDAGVKTSGESAILRRLREYRRDPFLIFDVVANKGQFLMMLAEWMNGIAYNAHAFEPSKDAFSDLSKYQAANVVVNNFGLGKEAGEYDLFYDKPGSGLASLTNRELSYLGIEFLHSEKVRVETMDNYCRMNNVARIDLLKIDVEGHELDVLIGASGMFAQNRIKMASFEFGGCNISTRTFFYDFFRFFKTKEMDIYRITPNGYLHPLFQYKEFYEQFRTTNFLAVKSELPLS